MTLKKRKYLLGLFLLICGVAYYGLEKNYIPSADDLFYKFYIDNPKMDKTLQIVAYPHRMIDSWSDIIPSQINQWYGSNGRFIVHATTQILTSFFSENVFVVLSTIVFCILLLALGKLSNPSNLLKGVVYATLTLIIIGTDALRGFMASIAFNLNYLWSAAATLVWLVVYERVINNNKNFIVLLLTGLFVFSMFVASLQESFTIGVLAGVVASFLMHMRSSTRTEKVMLCGYAVGAVLNIFAPANLSRSGGNFLNGATHVIYDSLSYKALWMLVITFCIYSFVMKKEMLNFIQKNIVYFVAIVITWAFGFIIAYNNQRQFTVLTLCAIILTIRMWNMGAIRIPSKMKTSVLVACLIYCIMVYVPLYHIKKEVRDGYDDCINQLMNTDNKIIYSEKYELATERMHNSWVGTMYGDETSIDYFHCMSALKTKGQNVNYIEKVMPLYPQTIVSKCDAGQDEVGLTHLVNGWYGYKTKKDVEIGKIVYNYQSMDYNPLNKKDLSTGAYAKIKGGEYYYYLFCPIRLQKSYNIEIKG